VAGNQPGVLIVAAAGGKPNDDPHRLAPVKIGNGLFIIAWLGAGLGSQSGIR
jgi:hypothetical protein